MKSSLQVTQDILDSLCHYLHVLLNVLFFSVKDVMKGMMTLIFIIGSTGHDLDN